MDKSRDDLDVIRTDRMFCCLAYGFIPSEYVGFELEHKTLEERAAEYDGNLMLDGEYDWGEPIGREAW